MRIPAALAFGLILGVGSTPASAQMGSFAQPSPTLRAADARVKLLEIAQDVDEGLLREAMLNLGRMEMTPVRSQPDFDEVRKRKEAEMKALAEYIEKKSQAVVDRAAELQKKRAESVAAARLNARVARPDAPERPGRVEDIEKAKVEVQLLRRQVFYSEHALGEAIEELAKAEHAAGDEDIATGKLEPARKKYEKAKANHVLYSKRLRDEIARLNAMEPQGPFGGGGGFQ